MDNMFMRLPLSLEEQAILAAYHRIRIYVKPQADAQERVFEILQEVIQNLNRESHKQVMTQEYQPIDMR